MSLKNTDMYIGVDIAEEGIKDLSAISVMCAKCHSLVFTKCFDNERENYLSIELPKKCTNCGKKFVTRRYKTA